MSFPLPIADSGIEALVWLVLAVIWFIVKALSKGHRHGVPARAPHAPARSLEDNLKDFLKNIEGMGAEQPPQAPPPLLEILQPPPPHAPEFHKQKLRVEKKRKHAVIPADSAQRPSSVTASDISAGMQVLKQSSRQSTIVMPRLSMQSVRVASLGLSAITFSAGKQEGRSYVKRELDNRQALRKAVVARVILGPPRGLE